MNYVKVFEEFIKNNNYTYNFTQDNIEYSVLFHKDSKSKISISYGVVTDDDVKFLTLNKNNAFKVINQVVTCIKDFIVSNSDISHIEFSGVPDGKFDWMFKLFGNNIYLNYNLMILKYVLYLFFIWLLVRSVELVFEYFEYLRYKAVALFSSVIISKEIPCFASRICDTLSCMYS